MINKLLYNITKKRPCRLIDLDSGPYLERYYLGQLLGATFYLHRFVSSDSERHIHNHPWSWGASFILAGSYIEERCIDVCPWATDSGCVTAMKRRSWFNRVDGNTFHRIHKARPGTWSLFFHGPRVHINNTAKGWGFFEHEDGNTVFRPVKSHHTEWWKTAKLGKFIGRVGL